MKIRKDLARILLFIATIYWGIWLGGYIFNAVMLVPFWSHNPPDSMTNYFKETHSLIEFFTAVNPWAFLATLIAWLSTIKLDTGARAWLGRATLVGLLLIPLKVFMIATIGGLVDAAFDGTFKSESLNTLNLWKNLNWVTITIATVILTFHLLAILNFNNPRRTKEQVP